MLKNIISILIILSTISLFANGKVDSLVKFIDNNKNEEKVDALLKLSEAYFSSDFSKSISLSKEALALSEKLNYQLGIAVSNNNIGYTLTDLGNFQEALNHYQISIELFKKLGEQNKEAIAYNDIAYIYQSQGLVEKAIENYIKSLKLLEEIGDKASLGACLNNIGLLYHDQKNYEKALEYYLNGLKVKEELGDEKSIAVSLNNIGSVYFSQEQYYEAKEYFFKSLFKRKKVNDKPGIAQSLINISGIYREQKQYDKALEYLLQSKDIQEEINNNVGLVDVLQNIGVIYNIKGDYEKAQIYLEKAYNIAKTIGSPELIKNTSLSLSNYYRNIKLFEKAYRLIVEHHKMSDSINNIENVQKIIQVGLQYEFEKKLHKADIEQLQKNHQHEIAIKEQKMISYSFGIGLLALIILSIVILKSLIDKKKANIRILEQKKEIEVKSVKLEESLISITDSINYAKRIQEALLQTERNISEHMTPHFIFFKPKDIVSGDFYWSFEDNNTLYIAAADCTGHGVPGALMSMLGISYLNSINVENNDLSPAEILNQLRDKITHELGQTSQNVAARDGMDISLAKINLKNKTLEWAGANNNLWLINKDGVTEIKADRQSINYTEEPIPFTNHKLTITIGDKIYLFTDGYADQFGGPKGKKFMYKPFKELLLSIYETPIEKQKEVIELRLHEWKGNLNQVDDICVIGIEF